MSKCNASRPGPSPRTARSGSRQRAPVLVRRRRQPRPLRRGPTRPTQNFRVAGAGPPSTPRGSGRAGGTTRTGHGPVRQPAHSARRRHACTARPSQDSYTAFRCRQGDRGTAALGPYSTTARPRQVPCQQFGGVERLPGERRDNPIHRIRERLHHHLDAVRRGREPWTRARTSLGDTSTSSTRLPRAYDLPAATRPVQPKPSSVAIQRRAHHVEAISPARGMFTLRKLHGLAISHRGRPPRAG